MSKQLYYIAIVCPEPVNEAILTHKHWMREHFGCKAALKSPAHITLIPSFLMEKRMEDDLVETLSTFHPAVPSLDLALKDFDHFGTGVVFVQVAPNEGLADLKVALENHLLQHPALGIRQEVRAFHAHVTIANRDLGEGDFVAAWAHFETLGYEAGFTTGQFALLQLEGARWEVLHTFDW
jgi:2'-5' RNA ligase